MARKRKAARETTGQGVLPLYYTKSEFEELHKTVIAYAEAIRSRNRNANERELSKEEVTDQFIVAVFHEYAPTDSACFELLGQVSYSQIRVSNPNLDQYAIPSSKVLPTTTIGRSSRVRRMPQGVARKWTVPLSGSQRASYRQH